MEDWGVKYAPSDSPGSAPRRADGRATSSDDRLPPAATAALAVFWPGALAFIAAIVLRLAGHSGVFVGVLAAVGAVVAVVGNGCYRRTHPRKKVAYRDPVQSAIGWTAALLTVAAVVLDVFFFSASAPAGLIAIALAVGAYAAYFPVRRSARKALPPPRRLTGLGALLAAIAAIGMTIAVVAGIAVGVRNSADYVWHYGSNVQAELPSKCGYTEFINTRTGEFTDSDTLTCKSAAWNVNGGRPWDDDGRQGTLRITSRELSAATDGMVPARALGGNAVTRGVGDGGLSASALALGRLPAVPMAFGLLVAIVAWVLMRRVPMWSARR